MKWYIIRHGETELNKNGVEITNINILSKYIKKDY